METKIREKIKQECIGYKTNFRGIDILEKYENDYRIASEQGCYDFDNCPTHYDCLKDAEDYCNMEHPKMDMVEECKECWKQAFKKYSQLP